MMMSDQGGYLQEQDLIEECSAHARYVRFRRPELSLLDCGVMAAVEVLTRRQLLNDLGIEQIRKAGIK